MSISQSQIRLTFVAPYHLFFFNWLSVYGFGKRFSIVYIIIRSTWKIFFGSSFASFCHRRSVDAATLFWFWSSVC